MYDFIESIRFRRDTGPSCRKYISPRKVSPMCSPARSVVAIKDFNEFAMDATDLLELVDTSRY
ncbi:MAG: hypothetical protein LQ348_005995, partial [Seirophora lacunosa]